MKRLGVNPSIQFFSSHQSDILKTRFMLFEELDNISKEFGAEARKILDRKLKANNNIPLLGELFPWILSDLIQGKKNYTEKVSIGWFAIYLYTIFLDEYIDNTSELSPTEFITGSLLASSGIWKISNIVSNTPYKSLIEESLGLSAKNQYLDSIFQKRNISINERETYSAGKNLIIMACSGALAAQNRKYSDFIINFTSHLLLALQYMDDICDYKSDFDSNNTTVLLNDLFHNNFHLQANKGSFTKRKILIELVYTGSLQRVLNKLVILLKESIEIIHLNNLSESKPAYIFFNEVLFNCQVLNKFLTKNNAICKDRIKLEGNEVILDKIENHLIIIAQST